MGGEMHAWLPTQQSGGARAQAGQRQEPVARLLHADDDIPHGVQEGRDELQGGRPQALHVQRHALGVALQGPDLRSRPWCQ